MFNMRSSIINDIISNNGGMLDISIPLSSNDYNVNLGGIGYNANSQQMFNPYSNMGNQQIQQPVYNPQQMNYQQPQMNGYNPQQMNGYNPQQVQQPQMNGYTYYQPQISQPMQQNTGYYNGMYNNYVNPYMAQRQKELFEAQQREMLKKQCDMAKFIARKANKALGYEVTDEDLKVYDPIVIDPKYIEACNQYNHMMYLDKLSKDQSYNHLKPSSIYIENNNRRFDLAKQRFPDDTPLYDFLANAGELYAEIKMDEAKKNSKQLNQLYNNDDYKQLINIHKKTDSYYNNFFNNNGSIDDMEITLPSHLNTTYQQRKQDFINDIMKGYSGSNGSS